MQETQKAALMAQTTLRAQQILHFVGELNDASLQLNMGLAVRDDPTMLGMKPRVTTTTFENGTDWDKSREAFKRFRLSVPMRRRKLRLIQFSTYH